jgi:hypothetical protein
MQINEEIWGKPDKDWQSVETDYNAIDAKIPASDRQTLQLGFTNGAFPLNSPMDWSIAPWGINAKSAIIPSYIWDWTENGEYKCNSQRIHRYDDTLRVADSIPFILCFSDFPESEFYALRNLSRYTPDVTTVPSQAPFKNRIICDFNYQKLFIVPFIGASSTLSEDERFYDAASYFDTYHTTKPFIKQIAYILYAWRESSQGWDHNAGLNLIKDFQPDNLGFSNFWFPYENGHIVKGNPLHGFYPFFPYSGWGAQYISTQGLATSEQEAMTRATAGVDSGINTRVVAEWFDNGRTQVASANYFYDFFGKEVTAENWEEVRQNLLKEFAYIGLPFWLSVETAHYFSLQSEDAYLPKFDSDGITTGEYVTSITDKIKEPNYTWENNLHEVTNYDPSKRIPKNEKYDVNDEVSKFGIPNYLGLRMYRLTTTTFSEFLTEFTTESETTETFEDIVKRVLTLRSMPYPFLSDAGEKSERIKIGSWEMTTQAYRMNYAPNSGANLETITTRIPRYYDDFRDDTPYTNISLYCPFCGTMELDPTIYLGHEVHLRVAQNIFTGEIMWYIFVDGHLHDTMNGMANVDVPLSGENWGTYAQLQMMLKSNRVENIATGVNAVLGNIAGATISGSFGNTWGVITQAGMGVANLGKYAVADHAISEQISKSHPSPTLIQKGTSSLMANMEMSPAIYIYRTQTIPDWNFQSYGHTHGFACYKSGKLSDFKGFTVVDKPDITGLSCSEEEKEIIYQYLVTGVRL